MTDQELQELREWAAGVMGWMVGRDFVFTQGIGSSKHILFGINKIWTPDLDLNQTFMLVERMKELGWDLYISILQKGFGLPYWPVDFVADFQKSLHGLSKPPSSFERCDKSLALAILLAARATGVE